MRILFLLRVVFLMAFLSSTVYSQSHPCVYFSMTELQNMRDNIAIHADAANLFDIAKRYADVFLGRNLSNSTFNAENFVSMAFVCLYDSNHANFTTYFNRSIKFMDDLLALDWTPSANHLQIASKIYGLAVGYDFLYNYLSASQRQTYAQEIIDNIRALKTWEENRHYNSNNNLVHRLGALIVGALAVKGDYVSLMSNTEVDEIITFAKSALVENPIAPRTYSALEYLLYDESFIEGVQYTFVGYSFYLTALKSLSIYENHDWMHDDKISIPMNKMIDYFSYEIIPNPDTNFFWNNMNDTHQSMAFYPLYLLSMSYIYSNAQAKWLYEHLVPGGINYNALAQNGTPFIDNYIFVEPLFALLYYQTISASAPAGLKNDKEWPAMGLISYRNSFTDDKAIALFIQNKPALHPKVQSFIYEHNQPDRGNFTLYAYGEAFVVDAGYTMWKYYNQPVNNTVTIDGRDEARRGNDLQNGVFTKKKVGTFINEIDMDITESYNALYRSIASYNYEIVTTPFDETSDGIDDDDGYLLPVDHAKRFIKVVKESSQSPFYMIITDDIKKDGNIHDYGWNFRTFISNTYVDLLSSKNKIVITGKRTVEQNNMDVFVNSYMPSSLHMIVTNEISNGTSINGIQPLSTNAALYPPKNKLISIVESAVNPYFHIILYPHRVTDPTPIYSGNNYSSGNIVTIQWPSVTDYSLFKYENNFNDPAIRTNAKFSFLRKENISGKFTAFTIDKCNYFEFQGIDFVPDASNDLTSILTQDTLFLNGSVNMSIQYYAPNLNILLVNGEKHLFSQIGDKIDIAPAMPLNFQITAYTGIYPNRPKLTWSANTETDLAGYRIERNINDGAWTVPLNGILSPNVTEFIDMEILIWDKNNSQKVTYRIQAFDNTNTNSKFTDYKSINFHMMLKSGISLVNKDKKYSKKFELLQNFPNPFNPLTRITFKLNDPSFVKLNVYNLSGELVKSLAKGSYDLGYHNFYFNGTGFSSGIYIYVLDVTNIRNGKNYRYKKHMILLK